MSESVHGNREGLRDSVLQEHPARYRDPLRDLQEVPDLPEHRARDPRDRDLPEHPADSP